MQPAGGLVVLDVGNGELDHYQLGAGGGSDAYDGGFLGGNRSTFAGAALQGATDVALSGTTLWVLDGGNGRVLRIELATGTATVAVADLGWSAPAGLAVDAAGTVFVADTQNHRVLRYAAAAAPQVFGGYGTALGRFKLPRGLALGAAGELFVADSGNQRVQVLSATTGAATAAIGSAAQFAAIRGLALDDAGRLYVADATANAVHVFGPAAAGPVLRLDSPSREFGSVPVGVSLDRVVAVHNDGSSALTVSAVSSSSAVFAALTPTPLQVAPERLARSARGSRPRQRGSSAPR